MFFILSWFCSVICSCLSSPGCHQLCVCVAGGPARASGMLLQFKPMGSQDVQQLRLEAAEDKKVAALWLAAMHKVRRGWVGPEPAEALYLKLLDSVFTSL